MKTKSLHRCLLKAILASIVLVSFFVTPVHAGSISQKASFSISGHAQGATLTKDYYVFADWSSNDKFKVKRCNRSNNGNCKSTSTLSGKPSSLYYDWGSNEVQAILKENTGCYHIRLSSMKASSKQTCSSSVKSDGLSRSGDTKKHRQGWAKYGNYYLRGYGVNDNNKNTIQLYNSSKKLKKEWTIPLTSGTFEIEDVMVDGSTGQVWFTYGNWGTVKYYAVDKSVFGKWIKPSTVSGGSTPSSSSSGSGSSGNTFSTGSNRDDPYEQPKSPGYNASIETNFFGNMQDDGEGCGVYEVLNLIIEVLTYGIAIAAAIGIAMFGITYLTAKGNEAQATKAKRRIYEIVVGLVAYAILWAILSFLLPGGVLNNTPQCKEATKTTSIFDTPPVEIKNKSNIKSRSTKKPRAVEYSLDYNSDLVNRAKTETGKKMLAAADYTAQYFVKNNFVYYQWDPSNNHNYVKFIYDKKYGNPGKGHDILTWSEAKKYHCSHCSSFASLVEKHAKLLSDYRSYHSYIYKGKMCFKNDKSKAQLLKHFKVIKGNGTHLSTLAAKGLIAPGDVFGYSGATHTMIYAGKSNGKYYIFEATGPSNKLFKQDGKKYGRMYRSISGSTKIGDILHAKN